MAMKRVIVLIEPEQVDRLDAIARSRRQSRGEFFREALGWWADWLDEHGAPPAGVKQGG